MITMTLYLYACEFFSLCIWAKHTCGSVTTFDCPRCFLPYFEDKCHGIAASDHSADLRTSRYANQLSSDRWYIESTHSFYGKDLPNVQIDSVFPTFCIHISNQQSIKRSMGREIALTCTISSREINDHGYQCNYAESEGFGAAVLAINRQPEF